MEGGDLIEYLRKHSALNTSPEVITKRIIKQVATGIKALHDRNIIHRDIKLNNILMTSKEDQAIAFIGDFGSSIKLQSSSDTSKFRIGTPGYIAPEMLLGHAYSFGIDVWSLGCMMHLLLSGVPPFWDANRKEHIKLVCTLPLDLDSKPNLSRLSTKAKDLLMATLEKLPAKRLNIDEVLAHPWLQE